MTTDAFDADLLEADLEAKPQESKRRQIEDLLEKKRLHSELELDDYDDYMTRSYEDDLFCEYSRRTDSD